MATTPDPAHDGALSRDNARPDVVTAATGMTLFVGGLITVMGAAHLQGVSVTATSRGYAYDARLAGLLLIGGTLVFGGLLCLSGVQGLARGHRTAWWRSMSGTILLLLVLVLNIPVQPDMAPGLSVLAAVNLIALGAAWPRLGTFPPSASDDGPQLVPIGAWDPALRICPRCRKQVAASRKSRCNHCGELLATRASPPQ